MAVLIPAALSGLLAGFAVSAGVAGGLFGLGALGTGLLAGGSQLVLGGLSRAMQKKPRGFDLSAQLRDRTLSVRQPLTARRLLYGQSRVGGPIVFVASSASSEQANAYLHLVIALAGHQVAEIGEVYLNDEVLPLQPSGAGFVPVSGRYSDHFYCEKHLGGADQQASAALIGRNFGWTNDHRLRGIAYLYVRLLWHVDKWPGGIPNISAIVRGKAVYDPRTGHAGWSDNAALCLADYLTDRLGLGAAHETEIGEASLIAAANACDELVARTGLHTVQVAANDVLSVGAGARLLTGNVVRLSSSGSLPGGLAGGVDYYWIFVSAGSGRLATSLANARAGIAVNISNAGTGQHSLSVQAEPRYTCNGDVDTGQTPREIIQSLLTAMGGLVVYSGGRWNIFPAVYRPPAVTLGEGDLRGPLRIQTRVSRREQFNGIKGVFLDPFSNWQPTDLPPVTNATYLAEDGGERTWKDINLPFTCSSGMAQRLGKVELERARQAITVTAPCKLTAFRVGVPDVVRLDNARMGWAGKPFEVRSWSFATAEDGALGVDLVLRETAAAVFDWNSGQETLLDPAPDTGLPNPFVVGMPGAPVLAEQLYQTRDGAGVKVKAVLGWSPSQDAFAAEYQFEYRPAGAARWTVLPRLASASVEIADIAPGLYDFRVKAINQLGVSSDYALAANREVAGLLAPPPAPLGLTVSALGGLAVLRWQPHPALDVRIGGRIAFRHAPALAGGAWEQAATIGEAVPGADTVAVLPLKRGTYFAKAVDSSGIPSLDTATASTRGASVLAFANLETLAEDPLFAGSHDGTAALDDVLTLTGTGTVDDIAGFDAVPSLDTIGGIRAAGTYGFAGGIDLGGVRRVRLASEIGVHVLNTLDLLDDRTDPLDLWLDFDGETAASADAQVWVRETDDDPAGTPAWSDWQRLDAADFAARAFQFQCRLFNSDPAYNIQVSRVRITADEVT